MSDDVVRYADGVNNSKIKLCSAQTSAGEYCKLPALQGRNFCQYHGGKTLVGHESPIFRTGLWSQQRKRFSTVAPELLEKIDALRNDPDLLSLKDDIAYITANLDMRAEAASKGVSYELYESLLDQFHVCKASPPEAFDKEFKRLGKLITDGIDAYKASDAVIDLIKKRADVIETEQRMAHVKSYTIEVDQAYSLIMQVLQVVKKNVRDPELLRAISDGIASLLKVYQQNGEDILDAEVVD
jgi:hypothetical protein